MAAWRRRSRTFFGRGLIVVVCFLVVVGFVAAALFAPLIAPYSPYAQDLVGALESPSAAHLLGQDNLGRDIFSRLLYGGRVSLGVSFVSGMLGLVLGSGLGLVSGYYSAALQRVIMGATDVLLSIPSIVQSLVLVAIMGGGPVSLVLAIGFAMVPGYIRMVNGLILSLRENDYIMAARLIGQNDVLILLKHLLPNSVPTLIVLFTINLGNGVLTESTLSYLGVGISPPIPSWGSMVSDVYPFLLSAPWLVVSPGLCIIMVIVSFNVLGDALRDALDPRLKGRL